MQYWNSVLDEVLQKDEQRSFFYTNRGRLDDVFYLPTELMDSKKPSRRRNYFLDRPFEDIHLTPREAETMFWIVQDYTLAATAEKMSLSSRTIEFYVKNMKAKLRCANKKEMIEKILQTNLLQQLEQDGLQIVKH